MGDRFQQEVRDLSNCLDVVVLQLARHVCVEFVFSSFFLSFFLGGVLDFLVKRSREPPRS